MYRRILACCLIIGIGALTGCISPPPATSGAGYINGTITTGPMGKMPPLSSRGMHRLGLVMECKPEVGFHTVGLTVFGNQAEKITDPLVSEPEKRGLFREEFNRVSDVTLVDLEPEQGGLVAALKFDWWNAKPSLQPSPGLDEQVRRLRAQGIDGLLFIREDRMIDFIGVTNQWLATQGLYQRFNTVAAYGGFHVWIIDLKTLGLLPNTAYTQALSRPFTAAPMKERYADYTVPERAAITEALKEVLRLNAAETAVMLKAGRANP